MGRITVFTDDACEESLAVRSVLLEHNIPFVEINLSQHPERRRDMICLMNDVATPQVFFNETHVASTSSSLSILLDTWKNESGSARAYFQVNINSESHPQDPKLRIPQPFKTFGGEGSLEKELASLLPGPVLLPLPGFHTLSIKPITVIKHLLHTLPRRRIQSNPSSASNVKHCNVFRGQDLVSELSSWLQLSSREAREFAQSLQDQGVFQKTVATKTTYFQDLGLYRLQPLQKPLALNTFCSAKSSRLGRQSPSDSWVPAVLYLCDLMDQVFSMGGSGEDMKETEIYETFQEEVSCLQGMTWPTDDAKAEIACMINVYNLLVRHSLIEGNHCCWKDTIGLFSYVVGGQEMTLAQLGQRLLHVDEKTGSTSKGKGLWNRVFRRQRGTSKLSAAKEPAARDPRLHFCLSWGTQGSPQLRTFHPQHLEQELQVAARDFCTSKIRLDSVLGIIRLPALIDWHRADFGSISHGNSTVMERLVQYLSRQQLTLLEEIHCKFGENYTILFDSYDWTRNYQTSVSKHRIYSRAASGGTTGTKTTRTLTTVEKKKTRGTSLQAPDQADYGVVLPVSPHHPRISFQSFTGTAANSLENLSASSSISASSSVANGLVLSSSAITIAPPIPKTIRAKNKATSRPLMTHGLGIPLPVWDSSAAPPLLERIERDESTDLSVTIGVDRKMSFELSLAASDEALSLLE